MYIRMIYLYICIYTSIFACYVASRLTYMYYSYLYLMMPPIEPPGREPPPTLIQFVVFFFGTGGDKTKMAWNKFGLVKYVPRLQMYPL